MSRAQRVKQTNWGKPQTWQKCSSEAEREVLVQKEQSGGKVSSDMKKKRKKRKVSYPVDQLLPLCVKVLIAVHSLVCRQKKKKKKPAHMTERRKSLLPTPCL